LAFIMPLFDSVMYPERYTNMASNVKKKNDNNLQTSSTPKGLPRS
jgi:hypothetical protein